MVFLGVFPEEPQLSLGSTRPQGCCTELPQGTGMDGARADPLGGCSCVWLGSATSLGTSECPEGCPAPFQPAVARLHGEKLKNFGLIIIQTASPGPGLNLAAGRLQICSPDFWEAWERQMKQKGPFQELPHCADPQQLLGTPSPPNYLPLSPLTRSFLENQNRVLRLWGAAALSSQPQFYHQLCLVFT